MGLHLNLGLLVFIFNVPLFIFAWRVFGLSYIFYSGLAVIFNVIALALIPVVKLVSDPLTNTLVGAALIGLGIGLCFNNGFTTGGIDIVVTYCQRSFIRMSASLANVVNGHFISDGDCLWSQSDRVQSDRDVVNQLVEDYILFCKRTSA